jgi:hypothetical protein
MGGAGGRGPHISQPLWSSGKKKALEVGGPISIDCKYFWESNKKQRSCDWRGEARSAPFLRGNEPIKTGARSARARTHGQNPLVNNTVHRENPAKIPDREKSAKVYHFLYSSLSNLQVALEPTVHKNKT